MNILRASIIQRKYPFNVKLCMRIVFSHLALVSASYADVRILLKIGYVFAAKRFSVAVS
jgi:hypothetical protein